MRIYILRHGIAEDGKGPDSERALTPEGRKKLREVLRVAHQAAVAPALILSSPYKRALQTAEMAADALGYREGLLTTEALLPMSPPDGAWQEIRARQAADEIMLVGHEPLLGNLIGFLTGAPSLAVDFKKGGLARIDVVEFGSQPRGVLKWLLAPKLAGA